jgi:hypothetical protein
MNDSHASSSASGSSSLKTMASILVGAVAVFAVIIAGVFFDIGSMLPGSTPPEIVAGSGRVTWEGRPLGGGTVATQPANPRHPSAVGFLDDDGNFDFRTQDANGTYQLGIVPGKHKVTVTHYGVNYPMGAPPATPPHYADAETTPVEIVVSKSPEENVYNIEVVGEPGRGGTIDELLGLPPQTDETSSDEEETDAETEAPDAEPEGESDDVPSDSP